MDLVSPGPERLFDGAAHGLPVVGGAVEFGGRTGSEVGPDRDVDQISPAPLDVDSSHGERAVTGMRIGDGLEDAV
jgi:hypothetical protein